MSIVAFSARKNFMNAKKKRQRMYDSVQKIHALFRTAHISARVEHARIVRSTQFINRH